jgi:hypothetical protein
MTSATRATSRSAKTSRTRSTPKGDHNDVNALAGLTQRPYEGRHRRVADVANLAPRLDQESGS